MKNILLIFFILFFCYSDSGFKKNESVILIISNPYDIKTNFGTGIDIKSLERLNYTTSKKKDTVAVPVAKYRKIYIRNDEVFKFIICQNADTVLVDIAHKNVNTTFLNRKIKVFDTLDFSEKYRHSLSKELNIVQSYRAKLSNNITVQNNAVDNNIETSSKEAYIQYYNLIKDLAFKKKKKISNALDKGQLSKANFEYNISQIKFEEFRVLVDAFKKTMDTFFKNEILCKYFKSEEVLNDDFMAYGYVNKLIKDIILDKPIQIRPVLRFDYKTAFDSLPQLVSNNLLKYSQFLCLKKMAQNDSYEQFEAYTDKYLSFEENEDMTKKLKSLKVQYKTPLLNNLKNVELITLDKRSSDLQQIFEKHRGKPIYVDFWASWCIPCRVSMPASIELHKEYKNKNVVFIYVSIDKDYNKWQNATKEENLSSYEYNFLGINYPEANFYEKLELKSIPRYMLFNKKGELSYKNAPWPGSNKTRELLNELLME